MCGVDPDRLLLAFMLIWESGQQNLWLFLSSRLGVDVKATFPNVVETDIGEKNTAYIRNYLYIEPESRKSKKKDAVMSPNQEKDIEEVLIEYAGKM